MAKEHRLQEPRLCVNNCGFFGSTATQNLCSKCFRDLQHQQQKSMDSDGGLTEKKDQLNNNGFDKESCLSRYEASLYRKVSPFKQPSYLVSRLKRYEDLHRRYGPFTSFYNLILDKLKSGDRSGGGTSGCSYVIWLNSDGELGNKMLSLASAFLYTAHGLGGLKP